MLIEYVCNLFKDRRDFIAEISTTHALKYFSCHQERGKLFSREINHRQGEGFVLVIVPLLANVILKRAIEPASHEIDVSLGCLLEISNWFARAVVLGYFFALT